MAGLRHPKQLAVDASDTNRATVQISVATLDRRRGTTRALRACMEQCVLAAKCELVSERRPFAAPSPNGPYGFESPPSRSGAKPWTQHFTPASGAPGTRVRIWGHNLLSADVRFNGVPAASVTNSGPNYVLATVPPGATTGPIAIATPGGTATTRASFTVQ